MFLVEHTYIGFQKLRFALSSEQFFHNQGGLFDYNRFYNDIVNYLNDPVCKPDTDDLIKWWNG